jgi:DNA-binding MarR family transcriptional regulator
MTSAPVHPLDRRPPRPDTAERLRLSVARLARLLRQQDDSGLGPTVTAALSTIAKHGPITLGDLAAREQVAPPTITKVVEKMVAAGLIERSSNPSDRRVSLVGITALGAERLENFRTRRTAWLHERLHELGADELDRLEAATDVLEQLVTVPEANCLHETVPATATNAARMTEVAS